MNATGFVLLIYAGLAGYLWFLASIWRGLHAPLVRHKHDEDPTVSVIIASRNEESSIGACIRSLAAQSYDRSNMEVIIVDDHSDDGTVALVHEASTTYDQVHLRLLRLGDETSLEGKPAAIATGVSASRGEIILCTDADCVVSPAWIRSMVDCFDPNVVFVAGPVTEVTDGSLLSRLSSLEFLGLIATGAGLIGSGNPIICNGANVGYRKSAFQAVGGFGSRATSCDDETLMHRMIYRKLGKVVFNLDVASVIETPAPASFRQFWTQRTRWAAKGGHYESPAILLCLICLYMFFVMTLVSLVGAFVYPEVLFPVLLLLVVKAGAEYAILKSGTRLFGGSFSWRDFVIAELFHVPYIVFAALIGQHRSVRWKNRTFKR